MKTLHDMLSEYIEHLESLNYSKVTRKTAFYNNASFIRWLGTTHNVDTPQALRKAHLEGWQRHLFLRRSTKGMPLKPRSVNKKIESVKGMLKFLVRSGYVQRNTTDVLKYVKQPKVLPAGVLDNSEMKRFLGKIDTSGINGYRDRAILELMYSCGLRAGEIVNLNLGDVNFVHALAKVTGKGNKERMVPIGKTALRFLETYIKAVRSFMLLDGPKEALFINSKGKRLQYHTLRTIVLQYAQKANLKEHITTHSFRRSCATEMIRGGANLYHVKDLLGHEDLQSLKHYTKLTINDLRKTHAKCHPRERS